MSNIFLSTIINTLKLFKIYFWHIPSPTNRLSEMVDGLISAREFNRGQFSAIGFRV